MGKFDATLLALLSEAVLEGQVPEEKRMYAIVFDLDPDVLSETYPAHTYTNVYSDIKRALASHGFTQMQGSAYFGNAAKVDAVSCVLAVMDIAEKYTWFALSVKNIRMLRIEDNADLMPAVQKTIANKRAMEQRPPSQTLRPG